MSVKDVIKKSVLESEAFNQAITTSTILTIVLDLLVAMLIGWVIYLIYTKNYRGVVFSRSFAFTLWGMTVLTAAVTLAISTNIVISLGMVGALSIVRFRTAVKEPLDLLYLFWAISAGITCGASMYILLLISTLIMFILVIIFNKAVKSAKSYIVVINYSGENTGDEIVRTLASVSHTIRSKVFRGEDVELTVQVSQKNNNLIFAEKVKKLYNVHNVTVLEFDGEYHG